MQLLAHIKETTNEDDMLVRSFKVALSASAIAMTAFISTPAYAGPSDDECAIWLCLPAGFIVGECDKAFNAMIKRVTRIPPKPPLPLLHQCLKGPGDNNTTGSFEHTESRWVPCRAGFEEGPLFREDLVYRDDGVRRIGDTNERVCTNFQTGESYPQEYGDKKHYITVTIDGKEYETFSFSEDYR